MEVLSIANTSFSHVSGKRSKRLTYKGTILESQDIQYVRDFEKLFGFKYNLSYYEKWSERDADLSKILPHSVGKLSQGSIRLCGAKISLRRTFSCH